MPLFTLPLSESAHSNLSRKHSRKRKRLRAASDSPSDDDLITPYNTNNNLHAGSTNPLSLAPHEIAQYRLAGLSLDEELPSQKGHLDWPHRALKVQQNDVFDPFSRTTDAKINGRGRQSADITTDEEGEQTDKSITDISRPPQGHRLRLQHLNVLTAIVHRCLLEGDIPRATRAYSLLLRAEVGGNPVDLKSTGYWGIGAELLVRSSERAKSNKFNFISNPDSDSDEEKNNLQIPQNQGDEDKEREWGTKAGRESVKSYYETLIVQYPYKKQFHSYFSSLNFWPAMVACEIYGIQYEQRESLRKINGEKEDGSNSSEEEYNSEDDVYEDAQSDFPPSTAPRSPAVLRQEARQYRRTEKIWTKKDEIRIAALGASEALAARMDTAMNIPPYDKDVSMLRLRGMIALYIGDLSVPMRPDNDGQDESDRDRRFLFINRTNAYERGKLKKEEHWSKAKSLFERCAKEGGEKVEFENVEEDVEDYDSEEHEGNQKQSRGQSYSEDWR